MWTEVFPSSSGTHKETEIECFSCQLWIAKNDPSCAKPEISIFAKSTNIVVHGGHAQNWGILFKGNHYWNKLTQSHHTFELNDINVNTEG